jgi:tetratricopeptide (TPR) repeat protein
MSQKKDKNVLRINKDLATEISAFLFNLGNQFVRIKNASAAFDCFKYAVDMRPDYQPAVFNLATLYNITGDRDSALRMFREACRMDPKDLQAKVAMAEVCRKLGLFAECERLLCEVLARDPEHPAATSAMAIFMYDQCRLAEASRWNDEARRLNPRDTSLVLNTALLSMVYGKWEEWWGVYEQMLSYQSHNAKMRGLKVQDSWQGQPCPGQSLLVISDQGAGDAIQFGRFLVRAKEQGQFDKVTYVVPPDLVTFISRFEGIDEVVGFGEKDHLKRDQFSSLLGIMRAIRLSTAEAKLPPIKLERSDVWRERVARESCCSATEHIPEISKKFIKVALVWAGDPAHGNDHNRSMPLAAMAPLLDVPGFEFFSFQVGKAADQCVPLSIPEVGSQFASYDDTAKALLEVDLLISVDTSVAHLAGVIGKKTFLLVPSTPEWRHLLDKNDSVWYDSIEIFRQHTPGDWATPVQAAKKALLERVW